MKKVKRKNKTEMGDKVIYLKRERSVCVCVCEREREREREKIEVK